ncbi:major facilitator superfamily domain-containing protein [Xylaria bambusicola]|uniref:major facilitator superfamily domain-containing protein n=1 Tax=Xylaria bambusicola TaxID=326684 RepID=UPI002008201F|nr:major facilitator superfamily domain-containing protein [Xylaria bambusicola]KAI0505858.1 major facilitator superfamily domain-containing protein [Xylaria bambusicola]
MSVPITEVDDVFVEGHQEKVEKSKSLPADIPSPLLSRASTIAPPTEHSNGSTPDLAPEPDATLSTYPSGYALWLVIAALVSSIFLISLDMTIVATAIPSITGEFGGIQDQAWYGSVFYMTAGGFQSTWGKTYRYFPLKLSYLTAIFIFEVGSLICGVAPNSVALIIGRAIAGVGAAGVGCGSYSIITFIAEPKKRASYTGLLGAIFGVGSVLGPLLGGIFSSTISWRWCFYINLPIGVIPVAIIVFLFNAPENAKPQEARFTEKLLQMDPLGTTLMMAIIISYLTAVNYGGQSYPWSSSVVIGLLVGVGVISIAFGLCEWWQGERAIIIPRLFKRREIGLSAIFSILQAGGFFSMIYYLPIYFQAIRGSSPIISGVQNLPYILSAMAGALGGGIFISATGQSTLLMIVGNAFGILGCGLCYTFDIHTSIGKWIGFEIIAGFGLGASLQIPVIVGQVSVGSADLSSATAIMLCFQTLGGAFWVAASQAVLVNTLLLSLPSAAPGVDPKLVLATGAGQLRDVFTKAELSGILLAYLEGIRATFILSTTVVAAAFVVAFFLPWRKLDLEAVKNAGAA